MKTFSSVTLAFIITIVFVFSLAWSAETSGSNITSMEMDDVIPVDTSITTGKFTNGLRYYIKRNLKPEKRAQLHLVVNTGSVLEDEDQRGLAHFCEHMAFNGTKNFAKHEIIDFLESIGMQFGPEINAYTGFDETVYMLEIPTDSAEIVEKGFQILRDWAQHVSFEDEEIDKERGVIIEEWRLGRGAERRMLDKQYPVLFKDSKYAVRLPIGQKEIIESFDYETIKRFYRDWYRPDLMAVVAVGDFDIQWIEGLIQKHFEKIPAKSQKRERQLFQVPDNEEPLFAIATDPEATRTNIRLYYKHAPKPEKTVADYRRSIVEGLYNSMFNERLQELTQQADPPFLYGYSAEGQIVRTLGVYFLTAGVNETGLHRGLEALLTEAERVRKYGFTQTELDRVKKERLRYIERAFKERDKTNSIGYAQEFTRNFLEGEPIPGIEYELLLTQKYIDGITLTEINQLAEEWITEKNRVVLAQAPEKTGLRIPSEENFRAIFESVEKKELQPYVDNVSDQPLIADLPKSGKIVSEEKIDEIDVNVWTLSNGVRVISKLTDFKNDEIRFTSFSFGGNSVASDADFIAAKTASDVVSEGGVGAFNLIELQKALAGKVVNVSPWIRSYTEGISGIASPADMETMFQLIHLYFTAPRKDTTAYMAYMSKFKGYLENRNARPESAFQDTLQLTLAGDHYRARPWSLELLQEMDLDKSFEFYKNTFANAGDFSFYFVGNFDHAQLKKLTQQYLAALPASPVTETWKDPIVNLPKGIVEKAVYKGIEPKSRVSIVFSGPFTWTRQNLYDMESLADYLRIKLREILREDIGGTYGVSVNNRTSKIPRQEYKFSISFGCDPDRVKEMTDIIFVQLDSLKKTVPPEKYMTKIKETQLREFELRQKQNNFWVGILSTYDQYGLNYVDILKRYELVEQLSAGDIQKTAQSFLKCDNYVQVVLYPEDKKE